MAGFGDEPKAAKENFLDLWHWRSLSEIGSLHRAGTTSLEDSFKLPGCIFFTMDFHEAVDPHPRGCVIRFEVVAGSSRMAVPSGFNPWRRALEARLIEEPMRGRANRQLIGEVAKVLGVSESEVEVLSGHKSARKVLLVKGITAEQAVSILSLKDPNGLWKDAA